MPSSNRIGSRILNTESGQDAVSLVYNSQANIAGNQIIVGGSSAGDASIEYNINGVTSWYHGTDNSDSDAYVISRSGIGTTNLFRASTVGNVNLPLQCSFFAYLNASVTNVTGDGTLYTLSGLTATDNTGSFFNTTTGLFSPPVFGTYLLFGCVQLLSVSAAMTTTTGYFTGLETNTINGALVRSSGTNVTVMVTTIRQLDTFNTTSFVAQASGGTKTAGVNGSSNRVSYVGGILLG